MPNDPYKATEEMFRELSDKELFKAIDRLYFRQQQLLLDAAKDPSKSVAMAMSLIHSQGTINMLFHILIERAKNGRTEE